jgi:hypothetical protein
MKPDPKEEAILFLLGFSVCLLVLFIITSLPM